MKFDSLSSEARFEVERVLAGELRIAPEYANLSDEAALYLLVTIDCPSEFDARFRLAMECGELPKDLESPSSRV